MTTDEELDLCGYCSEPSEECSCCKCELCDENVDASECNCIECEVCGTKLINDAAEYNDNCGVYHCSDCCAECGSVHGNCECCEFCGYNGDSCDCHSSFGHTMTPGWEQRGHIIKNVNNGSCFTNMWPELDLSIDPVQEAATFYLLEGISHGVPYLNGTGPFHATTKEVARFTDLFGDEYLRDALGASRKGSTEQKLKSIALEAAAELNERTNQVVDSFWSYVHIAISGESRHHQAIGGRVLLGPRDYAWTGWRQVYDAVGTEAINDLVELFYEFGDSSFGGKVWADAALILYKYERGELGPDDMTNKRMFLDRIFTMVHNNGSLLNKVSWNNKQDIHLDSMNRLLDAHAADEPDWTLLYTAASSTARQLMDAWYSACERHLDGKKLPSRPTKDQLAFTVCSSCRAIKGKGHYLGCYQVNGGSSYKPYINVMKWDYYEDQSIPFVYDEHGNFTMPEFKTATMNVMTPSGNADDPWATKNTQSDIPKTFTLPKNPPVGPDGTVHMNSIQFIWNGDQLYNLSGTSLCIVLQPRGLGSNAAQWRYYDMRGNVRLLDSGTTIDTVKLLESSIAGEDYHKYVDS